MEIIIYLTVVSLFVFLFLFIIIVCIWNAVKQCIYIYKPRWYWKKTEKESDRYTHCCFCLHMLFRFYFCHLATISLNALKLSNTYLQQYCNEY